MTHLDNLMSMIYGNVKRFAGKALGSVAQEEMWYLQPFIVGCRLPKAISAQNQTRQDIGC